ncbi:LysR family transcriptional regulator [Klebsiella aerogenes]|nr:LysR family transcriptional regulator [Klebsiella aerogenes]
MAATPYPTYGLYRCELKLSTLPLSPWLLKLPVLVASKSLRRSRQAGAARMDAG